MRDRVPRLNLRIGLLLAVLPVGCGVKGDLYLPTAETAARGRPPAPAAGSAPPASAEVPPTPPSGR